MASLGQRHPLDTIRWSWTSSVNLEMPMVLVTSHCIRECTISGKRFCWIWHLVGWKKDVQLLPKKIWYVVGVLALCRQPTPFGQLLEFFQYKNRKTFRGNYLNSFKQLGFLAPTKLDSSNASDIKYVITETRKVFSIGDYENLE